MFSSLVNNCELGVDQALNFAVWIGLFLYHGLRDRDPCARGIVSASILGHSGEFVHCALGPLQALWGEPAVVLSHAGPISDRLL